MKQIEVTLNVGAVAPLLDLIKPIVERLRNETAFAADMRASDVELEGLWREGLIHTQVEDCACFMGIFDSRFFDTGRIALSHENADPILRAASAIRLKLRDGPLKNVSDATLEEGAVEVDKLQPDENEAFRAYLFLATLQEIVIKHLGG